MARRVPTLRGHRPWRHVQKGAKSCWRQVRRDSRAGSFSVHANLYTFTPPTLPTLMLFPVPSVSPVPVAVCLPAIASIDISMVVESAKQQQTEILRRKEPETKSSCKKRGLVSYHGHGTPIPRSYHYVHFLIGLFAALVGWIRFV